MKTEKPSGRRWYSRGFARVFGSDAPVRPAASDERHSLRDSDSDHRATGQEHRDRSVWQDLAIVIVVVVMGYVVTSPGLLDRLLHGPPAPPPKGVVLVVSASSVDVTAVRQTVTPRGYNIVVAGNADGGIAHLQNKETNIGFIVIDGGIAEAKRLMDAATGSRPEARQIVLTGSRQIGDVSNRLIDAGIR